MITDALNSFAEQFKYNPQIENEHALAQYKTYIVAGMGGSHLAADILKNAYPDLPILVHADYGLPVRSREAKEGLPLLIAVSYSGNTEEAIDAFNEAGKRGLARIAVTAGGKLLELAQKEGTSYIQLPDTGIQPRLALGYISVALAKIMEQENILTELRALSDTLVPTEYEKTGVQLADRLQGTVPIIYTSTRNGALGYNWKVALNETGKIPAFYNVFPEMNHNEITSFTEGEIPGTFSFVLLQDAEDDNRIKNRMAAFAELYRSRDFIVEAIEIAGDGAFHKLFSSIILAYWTAHRFASVRNVDPEAVPVIEEFKKRIA